jgi:hypothetical protein
VTARAVLCVGVLLAALPACKSPGKSPPGAPTSAPESSAHAATSASTSATSEPAANIELTSKGKECTHAFIRAERSSQLAIPIPKGKPRVRWVTPIEGEGRATALLLGRKSIVVQGKSFLVTFGSDGKVKTRANTRESPNRGVVSIDPETGTIGASLGGDDEPPGAAVHDGRTVYAEKGGIKAIENETKRELIEGAFEVLGLAIGTNGDVQAVVKQKNDISLWTIPKSGGSIGRVKIPVAPRAFLRQPPVLGNTMRVLVLEDSVLALAPDGKKLWEQRLQTTGGATIGSDDRVLVAAGARIVVIEPGGALTELYKAPAGTTFVTPPVLGTSGFLFCAAEKDLHALSFD